jgi:hypothetical protein
MKVATLVWVCAVLVAMAGELGAAKMRYVPTPKPIRGGYEVGVYYFPGWQAAASWRPILGFPERKPLLGWYREGDPEVADWQIKWAVEHGITFFAYDWYWVKGATSLMHALHDGYFKAKYRRHLKFCLLWANHNPPGTSSEEDLLNVTKFWIENYFRLPEYLTIDGKPVVIIFAPGRFTEDMGADAVRAAFARMRELCAKSGLRGLCLIACATPDKGLLSQLAYEGYDAATGYNYPYAGMKGQQGYPYDEMVRGYADIWQDFLRAGKIPYMIPLAPGWDSRPWHGSKALVRTDPTPDKFKEMCERAKALLDSGAPGLVPKTVIVEAWNEFGEGDYIEPSKQFGFGYLDALREVFVREDLENEHRHITPEGVGLGRYDVKGLLTRAKPDWDFDRDAEGWTAMMGLTDVAVKDGCLQAKSVGGDPAFRLPPVRIDASKLRHLVIKMRADKGGMAQLFWASKTSGDSEERSARWNLAEDGQFHEYRVDLTADCCWCGTIEGLRFDPTTMPDARIAIDYVRITR